MRRLIAAVTLLAGLFTLAAARRAAAMDITRV
jgi:hypothetical protein